MEENKISENGVELLRIIRERLILFRERTNGIVVSNDLDGYLSGAYLSQRWALPIVGVFDHKNDTMLLNENYEITDVFYVDLDVGNELCGVGHHITAINRSYKLRDFSNEANPNILRGITTKNFSKKYPFSTYLLLKLAYEGEGFFHNDEITTNSVLFCDGTFRIINNYSYVENCKEWLNFLVDDGWAKIIEIINIDYHMFHYAPIIKGIVGYKTRGGFGLSYPKLENITHEFLCEVFNFHSFVPNVRLGNGREIKFRTEIKNTAQKYFPIGNDSLFSLSITNQGQGGLRYSCLV